MSDPPPPERTSWPVPAVYLVAPPVMALATALLVDPRTLPDTYELVQQGRCLLGMGEPRTCVPYDPWFWPPLYPLLAGALSAIIPPIPAAAVVSLLAMSLVTIPVAYFGRRVLGPAGGWAAVAMLLAEPMLRRYGMLADGRSLTLLLTLGAWALAVAAADGKRSRWLALAAGGVAGLAALVRPEAMATALLLPLGMVLLRWRAAPWAGAGVACTAGVYWAALSLRFGHLVLSSRSEESIGRVFAETLPFEWLTQMGGRGAWTTPLKAHVVPLLPLEGEPGAMGIEPLAALRWVVGVTFADLPLWLPIGMALGIVVLFMTRGGWRILVALGLAALPNVAAVGVFQGRDPMVPVANLLPAIVGLVVLSALGIVAVTTRVGALVAGRWSSPRVRTYAAPGILAALLVPALVLGLASPGAPMPSAHDQTGPGQDTTRWLMDNTPADCQIASALETAPVVHRARRSWTPTPSLWEPGRWDGVDWLVLSDHDPLWHPDSLSLPHHRQMVLRAYRGSPEGWLAVVEIQ